MAGRPKQYNDEELIDRAEKVFWDKGYNAASAQDLMKAMDIGQGSFYLAFKGGKKELYTKSLVQFSKKANKVFNSELSKAENPIDFLRSFFYSLVGRSDDKTMRGCYLGNALVELSNLDDETRLLSAKLLCELEQGFKETLILAQKQGKLSSDKSPEILAKHLINLWNGINITQRMNPDNEQLKEVIKMSLAILD